MAERTSSGLKAAQHLTKAADGGTLRKGFSLWRATSHLKVAAAGAGDLIKRHPAPAALIGGRGHRRRHLLRRPLHGGGGGAGVGRRIGRGRGVGTGRRIGWRKK